MLSNATVSYPTDAARSMQMFATTLDFDYREEFDSIPAMSLTHPPTQSKPYVYGEHMPVAIRIRQEWNRTHPADPMP